MNIEKHLKLTGISNISWKDAISNTVAEASKTLDYLNKVVIISQYGKISGKKIMEFHVELELTFLIDKDREA